jgi:D-tyrosyl-tRNA(Tyr) deacylase
MRCVIQRVSEARVTVDGRPVATLGRGLMVFLGLGRGDTIEDLDWVAGKVSRLRVFEDAEGKMNLSAGDVAGGLCVISQFTLYGDCRRGNRPSWTQAMAVEDARAFWPMVERRFQATGLPCVFGEFQTMMAVDLINDGPVTIQLDSVDRRS